MFAKCGAILNFSDEREKLKKKKQNKKIDELVSRGIKNLMKDASDFGCDLFVTYVCNHFFLN